MNRPRHILAIDQGTTSTRGIVFDDRRASPSIARRGIRRSTTRPRLGRARCGGHLARHARDGARGDRACRRAARRASPPSASPTSARPRSSGSAHRQADPPRHRLAGPAHAPDVRAPEGRTAPRSSSGSAPACCSIPISRPPRSPGCSTTSPARAARAERGELAFGTIDSFLLWRLTGGRVHATDVTNASRTLLFDIHRAATGTRSCCGCCACRARCCREVRDSSAIYGETAAGAVRTGHADRRHRRRPAGGAVRPGLLRARHGQVHLWHRVLPAAQHRRRRRSLRRTAC